MFFFNRFSLSQITLSSALACTLLASSVVVANSTSMYGTGSESLLVRKLPIRIESIMSAEELASKLTDAKSTYSYLTTETNLLIQMEAIRQAYWRFGQDSTQASQLMADLKQRYTKEPNNAEKYFTYGYAQLVFEANKNGLFFLRKANDKLQLPVTSLAYGLAEIDADLAFEGASPDEINTRTMDSVYKLKDALSLNKTYRQKGIWPTIVEIRSAVKSYKAYDDFVREDLSLVYVPVGKTSLSNRDFHLYTNPTVMNADTSTTTGKGKTFGVDSRKPVDKKSPDEVKKTSRRGRGLFGLFGRKKDDLPKPEVAAKVKVDDLSQVVAMPQYKSDGSLVRLKEETITTTTTTSTVANTGTGSATTLLAMAKAGDSPIAAPVTMMSAIGQTCGEPAQKVDPKSMRFAVVMHLDSNPQPEAIEFYNADVSKNPYYVRIMDITKRVIGQLYSPKAPFIMEDVDADGNYELVVRQFHLDPENPVFIYKSNGTCFVQDDTYSPYFM